MIDKELIQLYKMCNELETCEGCPERSDSGLCPINRYCDLDELIPRLEALLAENEHLREVTKMMPRWVGVDERLPEYSIPCSAGTEYSEAVILLTSGRKVLTAIYDGYGFIADAAFWDAIDDDITHWAPIPMPLPEPPSTEGGVNGQMRNL